LLLEVPVPSITGFDYSLKNIGAVKNKGWEASITTKNLSQKNFYWNTNINISSNKNEVLALGPEDDPIYSGFSNISKIGYPIASYYGYIFEGIYNTQEEIDSRPSLPTDHPGDPIIRDVNEDGFITADDRTIIGDNYPNFNLGINNKISYNNFDLSIFMQGVFGYQIYRRDHTWNYLTNAIMNVHQELVDRWRSPDIPGNGKIPMAESNPQGLRRQPSTLWVQDGDFLRISNVTLGYNLPTNILSRTSINSLRIYFQVQNLYTFTSYPGYNPEVSYSSDPLVAGTSFGGYPNARTFTIGINMSL
jgi:TonB-dependent starch-binding outer membrane protein SusC